MEELSVGSSSFSLSAPKSLIRKTGKIPQRCPTGRPNQMSKSSSLPSLKITVSSLSPHGYSSAPISHTSSFMSVLNSSDSIKSGRSAHTQTNRPQNEFESVNIIPAVRNIEKLSSWKRPSQHIRGLSDESIDNMSEITSAFRSMSSITTSGKAQLRPLSKGNPRNGSPTARHINSEWGSLDGGSVCSKSSHNTNNLPFRRVKRTSVETLLHKSSDTSTLKQLLQSDRRKAILREYLALVNKPSSYSLSGGVTQSTAAELTESQLFTSKVEFKKPTSKRDRKYGNKSKGLLNDLIDEVQDISMSVFDSTQSATGCADNVGVSFDEWRSVYDSENNMFESIAVFAEIRLMELRERERHHGTVPTKVKASVVADLLLRLCGNLEDYTVILTPLIYELLNVVFADYPKSKHAYSLQQTLSDFQLMHTYFDRYADMCEQLEELKQEIDWIKQGKHMRQMVEKFRCVRLVFDTSARFLRDTCFNLWKTIQTRNEHYRVYCAKKRLKYYFSQIRYYKVKKVMRDEEAFGEELDAKINQLNTLNGLLEKHYSNTQHQEEVEEFPFETATSPVRDGDMTLPALIPSSPATNSKHRRALSMVTPTGTEIKMLGQITEENTSTNLLEEAEAQPVVVKAPSVMKINTKLVRTLGHFKKRGAAIRERALAQNKSQADTLDAQVSQANKDITPDFATNLSDIVADRVRQIKAASPATTPNRKKVGTPTHSSPSSSNNSRNVSFAVASRPSTGSVVVLTDRPFTGGNSSNASFTSLGNNGGFKPQSPGFQVDPAFLQKIQSDAEAEEIQEQINRLADSILHPVRHVFTQTPDEWMDCIDEPTSILEIDGDVTPTASQNNDIVSTKLPNHESPDSHNNGSSDMPPAATIDVAPNNGSGINSTISNKYNLTSELAGQLISFIYSSMFVEDGQTEVAVPFAGHTSLLTYMREVIYHKYTIESIAAKLYKSLIAYCLTHAHYSDKRTHMFVALCGINRNHDGTAILASSDAPAVNFNVQRFESFIHVLGVVFNSDPKAIRAALNNEKCEIHRDSIIRGIPRMIPTIKACDPELYGHAVADILAMRVTNPDVDPAESAKLKVNIDDALSVLMDYMEVEEKEKRNQSTRPSTAQSVAVSAAEDSTQFTSAGRDRPVSVAVGTKRVANGMRIEEVVMK